MSQKILSKNKITIHSVDPVCQKNFELLYYDHRQQITEEKAISSVLTFLTNRNTFENESCTPVRIDELTVLEHRRVTKKQQWIIVKFVRNWIMLLKVDMLQPNQMVRKGANTMKDGIRKAG